METNSANFNVCRDRAYIRHTVLRDAQMANTIGNDSKNTVMKKFFQLLELVLLGKRKKRTW